MKPIPIFVAASKQTLTTYLLLVSKNSVYTWPVFIWNCLSTITSIGFRSKDDCGSNDLDVR